MFDYVLHIFVHVYVQLYCNYTTFVHTKKKKVFPIFLNLKVSEFKLQLSYYIYFWTNTLGKCMKPFIPAAIG